MFEHRPFGQYLKFTVRGASHAPSIRFILENFPAGLAIDVAALRDLMLRRAPGRNGLSSPRQEPDEIVWLAGVVDGVTSGEPIVGEIRNTDIRPDDYVEGRTIPRPGHADFGQWVELGYLPSGGGANSGRLTAAYCAVGALCLQLLKRRRIDISSRVVEVGGQPEDFASVIASARDAGDSVGGVVEVMAKGLPAGLGGARFAGLESELSAALFGIPGVKGVEFGNGFSSTRLRGSENDDEFSVAGGRVTTDTNRHGGILGGRTTGMPLEFRVAIKPTPTVFKPLKSINLATMTAAECLMKGRHDPCIVPRALPVTEAITAFVIADRLLATNASTSRICLTLTGHSLAEDWAQFLSERYFVDLMELRVDLLNESERPHILDFITRSPVPVIVTFRRQSDGGEFAGPESTRIAFFRDFFSSLGTDPKSLGTVPKLGTDPKLLPEILVDFENDFRNDELSRLAAAHNIRIIRSLHLFKGSVPNAVEGSVPNDLPSGLGPVPNAVEGSVPNVHSFNLATMCRQLVKGTNEIAKLAIEPNNAIEIADYMVSAAKIDVPHVICLMGAQALATRALAIRLGSLWTYASVSGLGQLGHLSPHDLVKTYRFRIQERHFALYGVSGWPIRASQSPKLHNRAFADSDIEAIFAPFPAETASEVVSVIRKLNIRGMAITIPHKEKIMPFLDEISPEAQAIGAVNTIVNADGRLVGHNTDAAGFAEAFTNFVGSVPKKLRVAVLGAGGASKAVVYALQTLGMDVTVFHRQTPPTGYDVLVNATPVDPIPDYRFTGAEMVYDLVYVPAETPLMARARAAGCKVQNGLSMLMAQARRQREIWGC